MNQRAIQEAIAAAYAADVLEPGLRLLAESQAEVSRGQGPVALAAVLGGVFLEQQPPVQMAPQALAAALEAIASDATSLAPVADEFASLPESVRVLASSALTTAGWRFAGFGIRSLPLDVGSANTVELLRIEPGAKAPRHSHNGVEYTLVLTGAFRDSRGLYHPGDIAVASPGITHEPAAEGTEICYSLAVSEAAPTLAGALGLIQRLWPN